MIDPGALSRWQWRGRRRLIGCLAAFGFCLLVLLAALIVAGHHDGDCRGCNAGDTHHASFTVNVQGYAIAAECSVKSIAKMRGILVKDLLQFPLTYSSFGREIAIVVSPLLRVHSMLRRL